MTTWEATDCYSAGRGRRRGRGQQLSAWRLLRSVSAAGSVGGAHHGKVPGSGGGHCGSRRGEEPRDALRSPGGGQLANTWARLPCFQARRAEVTPMAADWECRAGSAPASTQSRGEGGVALDRWGGGLLESKSENF
jgi:hypothetical protein